MTCDIVRQRVSELVDRPDGRDEAIEAHLASCEGCRALLADLRRIREIAATLERHPVPAGAWKTIASRLADERRTSAHPRDAAQRASPAAALRWPWLAAAAALLVMVAASIYVVSRPWLVPSHKDNAAATSPTAEPSPAPGNASPEALVESIDAELKLAAQHYENAINRLEQVANATDSPVDPQVMTTLRSNLAVIDRAIGESRQALREQPGNPVAQESLFEAFRRKVALLQDTIALMNEMRKGDEAGAARIVEGLNKS